MTTEPLFKSIFGQNWEQLPTVMKRHYAVRAGTDDKVIVDGVLDVFCAGPIKWFAPLFWIMRGIPPMNEKSVPVRVTFDSNGKTNAFHFNREFQFKKKPYAFRSYMIQIKGNEVAEIMRSGLAWKMRYIWEEGRVKLVHAGYGYKLFGHMVPLPITFLIGKGYAEEIPVDDNTFDMFVHITHPLWGKIYEYKGRFSVVSA